MEDHVIKQCFATHMDTKHMSVDQWSIRGLVLKVTIIHVRNMVTWHKNAELKKNLN